MSEQNVSAAQVAEWKALADAVSQGLWKRNGLKIVAARGDVAVFPTPATTGVFECSQNADFFFAARTAVPALCDALTESREEVARERRVRETAERESMQHAQRTAELHIERDDLRAELTEARRERDESVKAEYSKRLDVEFELAKERAELATLRESSRPAGEDTKRIDWLNRAQWPSTLNYLLRKFLDYDDLRCAIDAAMAKWDGNADKEK